MAEISLHMQITYQRKNIAQNEVHFKGRLFSHYFIISIQFFLLMKFEKSIIKVDIIAEDAHSRKTY